MLGSKGFTKNILGVYKEVGFLKLGKQ